MSETTEQKATESTAEPVIQIVSLDPAYEQWYQKLLSELRAISNKEGNVILTYKYQMGKAILKARREYDKIHPPTGPKGWTTARHNIMKRLKNDLGVSRSDLYACLRFLVLGLRRGKDGWNSFEEFSEKRFAILRGDSPQGETRIRGKDLTWREVKEQVLRGKKRTSTKTKQSEAEAEAQPRQTYEASTTLKPEQGIEAPRPAWSPSLGISIVLPEEVDRKLTKYATKKKLSREEAAIQLLGEYLNVLIN
jgi:hypothetical protein